MTQKDGRLRILNWNIAGAKYLELSTEAEREAFRDELNAHLKTLLSDPNPPDVVTLQEVVQYEKDGKHLVAKDVINNPEHLGYDYYPRWLIDTRRHSAQGKWHKVMKSGNWTGAPYFAQGNAILVKQTIPHFPIWSIPDVNVTFKDIVPQADQERLLELVPLESGLYFGNRDTEPRAALVVHLVISELCRPQCDPVALKKPVDIFVVNLHLTTLTSERQGIPEVDEAAAETRLRQLKIVLNAIVSRYNQWRLREYRIRDEAFSPREGLETVARHSPIWVIAGDFNFTPESREYSTIVRRGFIDLIQLGQQKDPETRTGTKMKAQGFEQNLEVRFGDEPAITLDYIFAGPRFEAIDPSFTMGQLAANNVLQNIRVSDHLPLLFDLPIRVDEDEDGD